jgi:exonuclease SbcC
MNPLRVRIRNLRTFRELDLDLPDGQQAILGSNGAGKSTLATAVDWALFGPDARSWQPYLTQGAESTELMLELTFEHAGETFRVRRGYSGRGTGKSTLDLEQDDRFEATDDHAVWVPLTRETVKATQDAIEQLLGLNRATFRASSMLFQGDGGAFTEAQPRDRKQILAQILGLDRWDGYLAKVRADIKAREQRLERLAGQLAGVDEQVAQREELERAVAVSREIEAAAIKDGAAALLLFEQHDGIVRAAAEIGARRAAAEARLAQAQAALGPIERAEDAAIAAMGGRADVQDEIESLPTESQLATLATAVELMQERIRAHALAVQAEQAAQATRRQRLADIERLNAESTAAGRQAAELLERATVIRDAPAAEALTCDHCGQPLALMSSREHAADVLEAEAAQHVARGRALAEQAVAVELPELPIVEPLTEGIEDEIRQTSAQIVQARTQHARLAERLAALTATVNAAPDPEVAEMAASALTAARVALDELPAATDPSEVEQATAAARVAQARIEEERIREQAAAGDRARAEERLRVIAEAEQRAGDARAEQARIHADLDQRRVLERAYGRDGVPAWIVSQVAIPTVEAEACRILAELGTPYRVELRTERATGTGAVVDALDVIVSTDEGERPYETFSGGERTRINLALRIALARLLANRKGAESRLLVIDEPEFLDADGTAALVQVLRGLVDFSKVWLISHLPALRDAPLDGTVEVSRDEAGWSTVTVA